MRVRIELRGISPMLMHNVQLADPDNKWTKEISAITGKRKKTEEDRKAIARLEWFGSLYVENGVVVMPTANIRKTLINAAKLNKLGTAVQRGLHFTDFMVPLSYSGPKNIEELYEHDGFQNRAVVRIQSSRTVRVRPQFTEWAIVADAQLVESALDYDSLEAIIDNAGVIEGLGDGRSIGFGRFEGKVKKA